VCQSSTSLGRDGIAAGELAVSYSLVGIHVLVLAIAPIWLARTVSEAGRSRMGEVDSTTFMAPCNVPHETMLQVIEQESSGLRYMERKSSRERVAFSALHDTTWSLQNSVIKAAIRWSYKQEISSVAVHRTTPYLLLAELGIVNVVVQSLKHEAKSRLHMIPLLRRASVPPPSTTTTTFSSVAFAHHNTYRRDSSP